MRTAVLLRSEDIVRAVDERLNELVQGATVLGPAAPITIKSFTGREWDPETELYYYRARYYDPKAGRFVSEDPVEFGGGVNFYGYVAGNPTRYRDPGHAEGLEDPPTHPLGIAARETRSRHPRSALWNRSAGQ
jgi:RHS repeat-associated protein